MFGYVTVSIEDCSDEEKARYQEAYCGLCRTLKEKYGQLSRFGLTYDMTFLLLLLSSLYEPEERRTEKSCPLHPKKANAYYQNIYTEYAADMTVALVYYKCLDDWQDDGSHVKHQYAKHLSKYYPSVQKKWPRQCTAIEESIRTLSKIEKTNGDADQAANCFGKLLGEVFVYQDDIWAKALRQFGAALGRFIYMMDAAVDLEEDKKRGRYNPLIISGIEKSAVKELLIVLIGDAAEIFEKLPLVQDAHLLRSVLYAGVWRQYNGMNSKKGAENGGTGPT